MPAGVAAYTALANVTLGSSAASVTFSSISQSYRDLVLVINASSTMSETQYYMKVNGNSSNYYSVWMAGNGSTTNSSSRGPSTEYEPFYYSYITSSQIYNGIMNFMDYSATDKHKTALIRGNNASFYGTDALVFRWANTAAITSIALTPYGGSWATGSTFALYGVSA
jgi:hypothetical protein